jgi:hypothetical protein
MSNFHFKIANANRISELEKELPRLNAARLAARIELEKAEAALENARVALAAHRAASR